MIIKKLSLVNYKNFSSKDFKFGEKLNCLVGNNGVGKTNVLDAIYHLSYTKGYFNSVSSQNIRYHTDFFVIEGVFDKDNRSEVVSCSLKRGQKKVLKRNGKEYEKLSDHFGLLPVVIISPADTDLIREGSDVRRKFMDSIISSYDRTYLTTLVNYNRVLSQRNSLLKYFAANHTFDADNIEIYNLQLVNLGEEIFIKRKDFLKEFIPIFENKYKEIIGTFDETPEESVSLAYRSQLLNEDFCDLIKQNIDRDRLLQYTGVGLHKDDLVFSLNGYNIKKNGSQGQQKSFLIALKLAQYDFIKKHTKITPILLLDDIFDKLDENRVSHLIELVSSDHFGQVFITDTHPERTRSIIKQVEKPYEIFNLETEN
ncbi:MAG: DNA replication and repair protein RecF [Flavobacteriia bacterium]|nr:MAG: DNA replication and repair protein RecF [Flavobacteriia bacterium]